MRGFNAALLTVLAVGVPAAVGFPAHAADLAVGLATAASSADPHFHELSPNNALARHIFGALIRTDAKLAPQPDLAASWTLLDDRSWKFALRPDVKFHDGSSFTANDVVFSLCRARPGVGPTQSFTRVPRLIDRVEVTDPHSIVLHTNVPYPLLADDLAGFAIISAHSAGVANAEFTGTGACGLTNLPASTDFDGGRMANGTGPYRLARYVSGEVAVLEGDPGYHGNKPKWNRVTLKPVPRTGARLAGLLSGDFDMIEYPAAQDLPTLKQRGGFDWVVVPSDRVLFLQPDIARERSPFAADKDGRNPLRDPRVREAISLAIDRKAIASRLMDGLAVPAEQYLAPGLAGRLTDPPPRPFDPQRARALMAEAGYAEGFTLTLSATNDRYNNDGQVAQALGQYLSRIGIRVSVDAMTQTVFFPRRAKREFSLAMGAWGFDEPSSILRTWIIGTDQARAIGQSNYGGYHNEALDALAVPALQDMDAGRREKNLLQATQIALQDNALIPLYWETTTWAFKDRFAYTGRLDQLTDVDGLRVKEK